MSLFRKNPNETAYTGGKKHIADVIKNTGPGELLIWRQPEEDFNDGSTLIVMPGEEAVFIKGGVIEQVFSNGTYVLSTENYPFIGRLRNARTGGISVFNCVIYFVKKSLSIEVKWGTSNPVEVLARIPSSNDKIKVDIQAHGAYKLKIVNTGIFLTKLIGNNVQSFLPTDIDNFFFEEFQGVIVDGIANVCSEAEDIRDIVKRKSYIQQEISPYINDRLADYGLYCEHFTISHISTKNNPLLEKIDTINIDMYEQTRQGDVTAQNTVKQGQAEAQVTILQGQAEAQIKLQQGLIDAQIMKAQGMAQKEIMDAMGELGWSKQQAAEILKILAGNSGGGGLAATGAGLGMGMAMSGPFANLATQMISPLTPMDSNAPSSFTPSSSRFEEEAPTTEDPVKVLGKLKELLNAGLISVEEYNEKKKEILSRM